MHHPLSALRRRLRPALILAVVAGFCAPGQADEKPAPLRPEADDTIVTGAARLARGVYRIRDENDDGVLRITADGVTLDLTGATLIGAPEDADPDAYRGVGIEVASARGVTIRGGRIRGFQVAVRARNAPGLTITGLDASENFRQRLRSTPEREDPADWLRPHENDRDEWQTRYGAGFSLTECDGARISGCTVHRGQNGVLLTRCRQCEIFDNDFSFNSGWGIALYRSSHCAVAHNRCDWCVRGYSHGVYHRGQDSAGILVFEQCCNNRFVRNSATHGGDGFFLYAGHDTTQRTGKGGSNDNLVFENDFSHAVANGIEATFSRGNVFARNDCSDSDHGIWAGYSSDSLFVQNRIDGCLTAGISIEHGRDNRMQFNRITGGPVGIHLWWDLDKAFVEGVFGRNHSTASEKNVIHGNDILGVGIAVHLVGDTATIVRWNALSATKALLRFGPKTRPGAVVHNHFRGPRTPARPTPFVAVNESGAPWRLPTDNGRRGPLRGTGPLDPAPLAESHAFLRPKARAPETPQVPGTRRTKLPKAMPRGRAEIRIGPWGPLDPRLPHVFPRTIRAAGREASIFLSGRGAYAVRTVKGRVTVEPDGGVLPAKLRVRVAPATKTAAAGTLVPFTLDLDVGGRPKTVTGTLLEADWEVRFFEWSVDPRKDEAAFAALVKGAPKVRMRLPALAFRWRAAGPKGVRKDRFATLASTALRLDAGRYRIRTISDVGIRVYVDGKRVTDNWTHHAPTEDVAEVTLAAGVHSILVEHFEIDGYAHLEFLLERVD